MIHKLKYKIIIILMGVIFILLSAMLLFSLLTTKRNLEKDSQDLLRNILFMDKSFQDIEEMMADQAVLDTEIIPAGLRIPFIVVQLSGSMDAYSIYINQSYYSNDEQIDAVVSAAIAQDGDYGTVQEHDIRFMRMNTPDGYRISIADITMEKAFLSGMIRNLAVTEGVALAVFFIFSVLLAEWATKPVQKSWDAQKHFVADASHELKTPLTVILSNSDMLLKDNYLKSHEKLNNRIGNINSEARRMKLLVEDLLQLARYDSIEHSTELHKIDMSYIVMSTILKFEAVIYDQERSLAYDVPNDIFILGNEEQIKKLLSVFIDNAVKYSHKGCGIHISLDRSKNGHVVLAVNNEGSLIPDIERGKIFGRFYRVAEGRQNHGGFGLGLSIAQNIAKEHKCKISVESTENSGTTFYAVFPSV